MGWFGKKKVEPKISIEINGKPVQPKRPPLPTPKGINIAEDFTLLKSVYQNNQNFGEMDTAAMVKEVNPHADASTCPYCGVKHDFVAKRARKCPDCGKNMVVRSGFFITDEQVDKFQAKMQGFYDKQNAESRLATELKTIQDAQLNKDLTRLYLGFAEGFRRAAKLDNQKDSEGFDYWDRSWRYYNQARVEDVNSNQYFNQQSSISSAMCEALIDRALTKQSGDSRNKTLKTALQMLLASVAESQKYNDGMSTGTWVYERAKLLMRESGADNNDLMQAGERVAKSLRLSGPLLNKFNASLKAIQDYELFGDVQLFSY